MPCRPEESESCRKGNAGFYAPDEWPYAFCIEHAPDTIAALGRRSLAGQEETFDGGTGIVDNPAIDQKAGIYVRTRRRFWQQAAKSGDR